MLAIGIRAALSGSFRGYSTPHDPLEDQSMNLEPLWWRSKSTRRSRISPERAKTASNPKLLTVFFSKHDGRRRNRPAFSLPFRLDLEEVDKGRLVRCSVLWRPKPLGDDGRELLCVCVWKGKKRKKKGNCYRHLAEFFLPLLCVFGGGNDWNSVSPHPPGEASIFFLLLCSVKK